MTRKRFVKLLMAKGMSRNAATVCAKAARGVASYREVYENAPDLMAGVMQAWETITTWMTETIPQVVGWLVEMLPNITGGADDEYGKDQ